MASNDQLTGVGPTLDIQPDRSRNKLHPLHEAALKLAGMGLPRSKGKTRDLVAMLLSHGARAWRGGQPVVTLHLHVTSPSGRYPIRLRMK